jgi:hypothetical protein
MEANREPYMLCWLLENLRKLEEIKTMNIL